MSDFDRNSMCLWWPQVAGLGIPVPKTVVLPTPEECPDLLLRFFYAVEDRDPKGLPEGWEAYELSVWEAAKAMGFPIFLRTDLISGKHNWTETCFVQDAPTATEIGNHILRIVEEGEVASFVGMKHRAIVVREYVPLEAPFRAFRGMPVGRERRYFVRDGQVCCHHAYWIHEAVKQGYPDCGGWEIRLADLNCEGPIEAALLSDYARRVAAVVPGYWSVDFAQARAGEWYLIDMARGEDSWHPKCAEAGGD